MLVGFRFWHVDADNNLNRCRCHKGSAPFSCWLFDQSGAERGGAFRANQRERSDHVTRRSTELVPDGVVMC